jgi:hypothetical protein
LTVSKCYFVGMCFVNDIHELENRCASSIDRRWASSPLLSRESNSSS